MYRNESWDQYWIVLHSCSWMINLANKYNRMTIPFWRPLEEEHDFLFSRVGGPHILLRLVPKLCPFDLFNRKWCMDNSWCWRAEGLCYFCLLIFPLDVGGGTGVTVSGYCLLHPPMEQMILLWNSCTALHALGWFSFLFGSFQHLLQPLFSSLLRCKAQHFAAFMIIL